MIPIFIRKCKAWQGSKIAFVRSYLRVSQDAGQVKILIFLVKINFFPNTLCDAGQVPILRFFEACLASVQGAPESAHIIELASGYSLKYHCYSIQDQSEEFHMGLSATKPVFGVSDQSYQNQPAQLQRLARIMKCPL